MTDAIELQREGGLLTLRLNRPDKKNALTRAMYSRLAQALVEADADPEINALLICGSSECFTAGNDIADFLQQPPSDLDSPVFQFMRSLLECRKPVVAAVAGPAVGIGTTLLLHCDLVYVSRDARLRMPFVNLGLCPEFGSSLILPRLLGQARAAELLLLGEGSPASRPPPGALPARPWKVARPPRPRRGTLHCVSANWHPGQCRSASN